MEDRPDVSLHPPTIFFAGLVIGFILRAFLGGWLPMPRLVGEAAGGVVLLAGILIAVAAVSAFTESGEKLPPATASNALLTDGAFRWSRNPIYLSMALVGIGFGLATLNLWMILTSLATAAILNFFVIPQEEDYLMRRFGADYAAYRAKVRRWL